MKQVKMRKVKKVTNGIKGKYKSSYSKFPQVTFKLEQELLDQINDLVYRHQSNLSEELRLLIRKGLATETMKEVA